MQEVTVTKEDIKRGLRDLGLQRGDIVGVHSSLSSFGHVEGGADAVIDALLETVGEEGAVVMPTYSSNRMDVERTPEEVAMGVTWKARMLAYDPRETPCWTGKIPDTFWRRKNATRNSDPIHSLTAIGNNAEELCQGWNRLLAANGYILLIGVGLECCSAMHLAEDRVDLPGRIVERITPPPELLQRYQEPEWDVGFGPYPDFAKMEEVCEKSGITKATVIGKATVKLLGLGDLIELYAEALRNNPDIFYTETSE